VLEPADIRFRLRQGYLAGRRVLASRLIDARRGSDTATEMNLEDVGLAHPDRVRYEPTTWIDLRRVLRYRDVDQDDVFLDYGCGKGRVLLVAARQPYRRVVGVDISPHLCAIAEANLERDRTRRRCGSVEVVAADVTEWEVPDDVTVVFMHNPFRGATFERAIARLLASQDRNPRTLRVIYRVPMEADRMMATGRAQLFETVRGLRPGAQWSNKMATHIYELRPPHGESSTRTHPLTSHVDPRQV
jgi:SAM-dependent methyltransferase